MKFPVLKARASREAVEAINRAAKEIVASSGNAKRHGRYLEYHRHRLALDYDWIQKTSRKKDKICELGASPFFLTRALVNSGFAVYPVDFPTPTLAVSATAAGLSSSPCNIETQPLPFPDEFFDQIVFNEVFEHLRINLIFTAAEILRVLKPGGRLWLSTPNLRSLRGIVNFLFKGEAYSCMGQGLYYQYQRLEKSSMGHVREYTSVEVASFLAEVGFAVESVIYRGEYSNPVARLLSSMAPSIKPYFSIVGRRK